MKTKGVSRFSIAVRALKRRLHRRGPKSEARQEAVKSQGSVPKGAYREGQNLIPVPTDYEPKQGETVIDFRLLGDERPYAFLLPRKD